MRVLAIDTALEACSAALLDTDHDTAIARDMRPMTRGHAEALMPLIQDVMTRAKSEFADLDRIAVTTGPGSFTGLRVGISAARGIGLAADKPVIGLSTLSALSAPHLAADDGAYVVAAIDARHSHIYFQITGPAGREVIGPRIVPVQEATREAMRAGTLGPVRLVGSGALMMADLWLGSERPSVIDNRRFAEIDWVARLGALAHERHSPAKPLYLRAPDARPQESAQLLQQ